MSVPLECTPDSVGQYMKEAISATLNDAKPNLVSMIASEVSAEAKRLPPQYAHYFKEIASVLKRIAPGRYQGDPGYKNLIFDLRDFIDGWIGVTTVMGENSAQQLEDEEQWLVMYLVHAIVKILTRVKDNLLSCYYSNNALGKSGHDHMEALSYVVGQILNVVELYHVWGSILGTELEPEEVLDTIGQKLYASKNAML